MNTEVMRQEIAKEYPGDNWKKKVKRMPDKQVIAVYYSFKNKERMKKLEREMFDLLTPLQLTFEDVYTNCEIPTTSALKKSGPIRLKIPYCDTMMGDYIVCSRQVLLAGWIKTVGKNIDFDKKMRRVMKVEVVDECIVIDLK